MFLLKKKERIDNNSTVLHRTFKKKESAYFKSQFYKSHLNLLL